MAEYIDRDAAIAACFDGFADCRDDCAANIRNIPAADVVEVVRCKDCIHARHYTNKIKCGYWSEQTDSEIVCEDDFCSYGEKREER